MIKVWVVIYYNDNEEPTTLVFSQYNTALSCFENAKKSYKHAYIHQEHIWHILVPAIEELDWLKLKELGVSTIELYPEFKG